ncbi:MAG: polysaccharide biosynthesis protein, partial [Bacteroidetes bacterium]
MSVKALASQTVYYGISSIAAKFINYLLTPYLTYNALFSVSDNGKMSAVYSLIPMLNILFTYGMESAYFRFVNKSASPEETTNTTQITLLFTTVVFSVGMWVATPWLATVASLQAVPALISLSIVIIATDTLCAIPFARLRNEGRPLLFAFIRVSSILINIGAVLFFLSLCPPLVTKNPQGWASYFYNPATNPVVYILLANIVQNIVTLLLLQKWFWPTRWQINTSLLKNMLWYALPMLVAGLGGMVNETFDRLMLGWWLPSTVDHDVERGIYGACYKISLFVTLFIQAFRMGAEPFFFKQAKQANAPETYAKVTYYFVLLMALIFIAVVANMPILQYFVAPKYWRGLPIVPILLLANICLGIY